MAGLDVDRLVDEQGCLGDDAAEDSEETETLVECTDESEHGGDDGQADRTAPEGALVAAVRDHVRGDGGIAGGVLAAVLHREDEQVRHGADEECPREPRDRHVALSREIEDDTSDEEHACSGHDGLGLQVPEEHGRLPEVAALGLAEEEGGVARRHDRGGDRRPGKDVDDGRVVAQAEDVGGPDEEPHSRDRGVQAEEDSADGQPGALVEHPGHEQEDEALGLLEVPDEQDRGREEECDGNERRRRRHQRGVTPRHEDQKRCERTGSRCDGLGPQVGPDLPAPGAQVGGVEGRACVGDGITGQLGGGLQAQDVGLGPQIGLIHGRDQRIKGRLVGSDVEDVGAGVLLGRAHGHRLDAEQLADTTVGIVEVAYPDGLGGAHLDAGGLEALVDAVGAEVALGRGVGLFVDVDRVIGACLHAHLASDAARVVEVDNAVITSEERLGGATLDTRGVGAVIAAQHRHLAGRVGEGPLLDVLHPGAELPHRHLVLGLACHRARVAADAGPLIDGKAVAHAITSSGCRTS